MYLDGHNKAGTQAAVAIYFLIAFWYTCTIECTGYVYGCEIWPTYLRSQGATISYFSFYVCSIWATAPASLAFGTIGWKYYMVFVAVTIPLSIIILFYCPEVGCHCPFITGTNLLTVSPADSWAYIGGAGRSIWRPG